MAKAKKAVVVTLKRKFYPKAATKKERQERILASKAKYREKNRKKLAEYQRKYYAKNRKKILAASRKENLL